MEMAEQAAMRKKCAQLKDMLLHARKTVVYTGAGISTAASIPDYRGPNGVWTLAKQGSEISPCDPTAADPTRCHMALFELHKRGLVSHILSQNCDGLHLRSGIPQTAMSEVHGNMYIEVCKNCSPPRQYVRSFDVTTHTRFRHHRTGRKCDACASNLVDTIVHFGEVGRLEWPLNWEGVMKALEACDLILCIGSSLQILKKYSFLWFQDRPVKQRPKLAIINLQKTVKDKTAKLKMRARCDDVADMLFSLMNIPMPPYCRDCDPVLAPRRRNSKNNTNLMTTLTECSCGYAASVVASLKDCKSLASARSKPKRGKTKRVDSKRRKIQSSADCSLDSESQSTSSESRCSEPISELDGTDVASCSSKDMEMISNDSGCLNEQNDCCSEQNVDFMKQHNLNSALSVSECSGSEASNKADSCSQSSGRLRILIVRKNGKTKSEKMDKDAEKNMHPGWWKCGARAMQKRPRPYKRKRTKRKTHEFEVVNCTAA